MYFVYLVYQVPSENVTSRSDGGLAFSKHAKKNESLALKNWQEKRNPNK